MTSNRVILDEFIDFQFNFVRVLYLDGNHVLCANSPFSIQDFLEFDYIGAPGWGMFKGECDVLWLFDLEMM